MGIMRLCKHYSPERVERACRRALAIGALSYKSVKSILKSGLDQQPLLFEQPKEVQSPDHRNIRGRDYYSKKEAFNAQ